MDDAPDPTVVDEAGQAVHETFPTRSLNVPTGHAAHASVRGSNPAPHATVCDVGASREVAAETTSCHAVVPGAASQAARRSSRLSRTSACEAGASAVRELLARSVELHAAHSESDAQHGRLQG